jgi:bifunctional enzyme CysN/CysC
MRRDPKGLYARARQGKIKNFTGIDSPYEPPENAEIIVRNSDGTPEEIARQIVESLRERQIIG